MICNWYKHFLAYFQRGSCPRRSYPKTKRTVSLLLEPLEDRTLLAAMGFTLDPAAVLPPVVDVGQGSLVTVLPSGEAGPSSFNPATNSFDGPALLPSITADFTGPVASNEWWSAIGFQPFPANPSDAVTLQAHPLALRPYADGLGVSYPTELQISADAAGVAREYHYAYAEDFKVSLAGLASSGVQTSDYSDWTVTAAWENGADRLNATFGHGLPFIYCTRTGPRDALLTFSGTVDVWHDQDGVIGLTVGGHHYGLFAPTGAAWQRAGNEARSDLGGKDYFSVAVLPERALATLEFYRQHAYAFVTDTQVGWQFNEARAELTTTYTVGTELKESGNGNVKHPLLGLYRHQWLHSADPLTGYTYNSPRGVMKVLDGATFATVMKYQGVLPTLPAVGADRDRLYGYIDEVYRQQYLFPQTAQDTYAAGKTLQAIASLIPLAEQAGHQAARDRFLTEVKQQLEGWFDATDGGGQFYYDRNWNTLIGYPDSFGSARELNDHHFHYGYFIMAAGIVAQYDPAWAGNEAWGGMVETLVRDVANSDRSDPTFPFLRNFDPYAGHAWASGNSHFFAGNNQESSSEALNFNQALIVWGTATGNTRVRDLGVYLYTTEAAAVEQYWFDVDDAVFPAAFPHPVTGMVWGDGAAYATWWTANPEEIHGINFLPFSGGSLYLGRDPGYVQQNYDHMAAMNGGPEQEWQDRIWSYLAFADPAEALSRFNAHPAYQVSDGETRGHTYAWLAGLAALGQVDAGVSADTTYFAVFQKDGIRSYAAYNPGGNPLTVHFSDGAALDVAPRALTVGGGNTYTWSPSQPPTSDLPPTSDPLPTPIVEPAPEPTIPGESTVSNTLYLFGSAEGSASTGTLGFQQGWNASVTLLASAGGLNYDGTPTHPAVFNVTGLTGTYDPLLSTRFTLFLDAGTAIANGTQARVSYDFTGDGSFDRVETYRYFAEDDRPGWEAYTEAKGLQSASGALANLFNGAIRLEVWNAIGRSEVSLQTDAGGAAGFASQLIVPFSKLQTSNPTIMPVQEPMPTPLPAPAPAPTPAPVPAVLDNTLSISFAVIGDYGSGSSAEGNVANLVKSWNPDFIITTGDNNYGSGSADTIDPHIGQFYHDYIGNYTGSYGAGSEVNRFFPSLGNHDWGTPGALPYLDYFTLPGNERYYDFTVGPVEFFVIDSDGNEPDGTSSTSVQGQWLQSELAASTATWKLVYFHHAAYSSGGHGSETDMQWPFQQWGASAVLSGHDHTYERLLENNLPYFVNGLGGSSKYSFGSPVAGSQVRYNADYGAMLVKADDTQISFQFITQSGAVIDSYTINAANASPTITSAAAPTTATEGSAYSYQFSAAGTPTPALSASGLPAWLTFNASTGLLAGTPPVGAAGTSATIALTASNGILPSAVMNFTLSVAPRTVSSSTPFVFTNQTGQQVHFTMYGIDNSTGQWSYFRATSSTGDTFTGSLVPVQQLGAGHDLPTYSFAGPSATLIFPDTAAGISSAAIVMTVGPITPSITVASNFTLPRPAPSNPTLVNATVNPYYDFIEFTLTADHTLNINTTQVDQFGFPITLSASPEPVHGAVGVTPGLSRDAIFQAFVSFLSQESDPAAQDYRPLLQTADNGSPYRIIAPGQYLAAPGKSSDPLASYFDSALQSFFIAPPPLTLIASGFTFSGTAATHNPVASGDRVNGAPDTNPADNRDFRVIDFVAQPGSGALFGQHFYIYSPIDAPSWVRVQSSGEQVFANNGVFADNGARFGGGLESSVLGNLENQVVSALTRGIANLPKPASYANTTAFWTDPAQAFPAGQKSNLYAKFLHTGKVNGTDIFIGGRVYAFPYSDQGDQAAFFAVNNPASVAVTLGPWIGSQAASPTITSAAAPTTATVGSAYSYQFSAAGTPTPTLSASGLPAWLTFNASTGLLAGTPTVGTAGTSATIALTASSGILPSAVMTFTLSVAPTAVPALVVSPTALALGTTTAGTPGSVQTFTVSGNSLAANIVVQAPAGVEMSADGITYATSLQLARNASGTVAPTTIRARIAASALAGTVSGSIAVISSDAATKNVAVSGTVVSGTTATIGNTLYLLSPGTLGAQPGTGAQSATIASAGGVNHDGTPTNALVYRIAGLTGSYDPGLRTEFKLFLDAGTQVANGTQLRVSCDFDGNGVSDRVETYRYFAEDNRLGWEAYTQAAGLRGGAGSYADFQNGSVQVEIWNAIGRAPVALLTDASEGPQSTIRIPFVNLRQATDNPAVPALVVSPTTLALGTTTAGTPGSVQTFIVSGNSLAANIVIQAPAGVEMSADGITYTTSLQLDRNASGTVVPTTIRARIAASALAGTVSGSIAVISSDAATKNVAVSGTVVSGTTTTIGNTLYLLRSGALSTAPGSSAGSDTIASAGGKNYDGTPANALVYEMRGLTGTYDPARQTQFALFLDAGAAIANGTQLRVSYDFDGNGVFDRIETYRYFAEDDRLGWERYTEAQGMRSAAGVFTNLRNGSIRLEIWNAIGRDAVALRVGATVEEGFLSQLSVPFQGLVIR